MKNWFKQNATHLIIIGLFLVLIVFYLTPIWQGKILSQSDVIQAEGSQKELFDYKAKDGHSPLWTNSMFGGMPTYQIWYEHANNITTYIGRGIRTVFPAPADVLLLYLLGSYFLLSVLRIRPWLAAAGAIAMAFSSYNLIYIEAGHMNKAYAIAYMAPIIGAVILCYRGNRLWGGVILALFMALEIRTNHVQVTYYLFLALLVLVLFELYYAIRDKKLKNFAQATGVQLIAVVLAVLVNASVLYPTYEYSKLTIRGKANIAKVDQGGKQSDGLDKEYAYAWSQGIGESITFLIPNAYGGKTGGVLDENSNVAKYFTKLGYPENQAVQIAQNLTPTYWGEKTFTSGPWYFGAAVIFLFILGIVIVKDRLKWWIISATALILLLSFGRHFPLISDLFFDYFPMYNKFRAVESILVVAAVLIPLLAVLAINELITRQQEIINLNKKVLYTGIAVGGLCLLVAFIPDLFLNFKPSTQQNFVASLQQQTGDQNMANEIASALIKDRKDLASKDAYRSFFIVLIAFGFVWSYIKNKISYTVLIAGVGILTLIDLWQVDKRYLNDNSFIEPRDVQHVQEREVDQLIRMDKDLSYRVLDLTTNPFSDARASYFHKSLGGYHAAKLMRFQEILEHQFNGAINEDVLDMFNVRYIITRDPSNNSEKIQRRSTAAGNAWFVNKVTMVKDDAQEMQAISSFDPKTEAFVSEQFKSILDTTRLGVPTNANIQLTSYHPDTMRYEYSSPTTALAVFSEVYYDAGWKAYVDGDEVPIIRADYALRALQLPGGNHQVEFIFAPESMRISEIISLIASIVLILGLGFAIWYTYNNKKKKPEISSSTKSK